jgi:hypothetical protein
MFSSTMIELSTSMPTPSASPPSDMMFRETPKASMRAKVPTIEIGNRERHRDRVSGLPQKEKEHQKGEHASQHRGPRRTLSMDSLK